LAQWPQFAPGASPTPSTSSRSGFSSRVSSRLAALIARSIATPSRHEGIFALQSGIVPALGFQMILNGIRLGGYNLAKKYEVTVDGTGQVQIAGSLLVSGVTGCVGSAIASPFYLVIIWLLTSAHLASAAFS
jgi:hypothetical protein